MGGLSEDQWRRMENFGWDAGRNLRGEVRDSKGRPPVLLGLLIGGDAFERMVEEGVDFGLQPAPMPWPKPLVYDVLVKYADTDPQKARFFLSQPGVEVDPRTPDGATPLLLLMEIPEAVTLLLEFGADPTIANIHGQSPLKLAQDEVEWGNTDYDATLQLLESVVSRKALEKGLPEASEQAPSRSPRL
jgi:hypothetical protein